MILPLIATISGSAAELWSTIFIAVAVIFGGVLIVGLIGELTE
jgi:hypothetical protein